MFLKAVSPSEGGIQDDPGEVQDETGVDEDGENEGEAEDLGEFEGEVGERLGLQKEEEVLKRIRDPKLPSQEEIERHCLCGHIPYRD